MILTLEDYFGHHSAISAPSAETKANALELLSRVNAMLAKIDLPEAQSPKINSGWRPAHYNAIVPGAAPKSKHISGEAIDLADPEGALDNYIFDHRTLLSEHNLWLEHPLASKGWTHLQSVPPRSGNRVFFP